MSSIWGTTLRLSVFGESHGPAIGAVLDGVPAGEWINMQLVQKELDRRAPGKSDLASSRKETDQVEILSGLLDDVTTGAPICGIIRNQDGRPDDYQTFLRPGHADMAAHLKYGGLSDRRGGGHFSGRLTASIVFAGAICKQILDRKGISVFARIVSIGCVEDEIEPLEKKGYWQMREAAFPVFHPEAGQRMQEEIRSAKNAGDSVGGVVEVVVFDVPPGLGAPFFDSVESGLAAMLFSVPAVKGVEFGAGFDIARMRGSAANDPIALKDNALCTLANRNGGILGGITTGMPLVCRVALKPTPSIALPQKTVDPVAELEGTYCIHGRHDPCVVPRAVPVLEAGTALVLLEKLLQRKGELQ